MAEGDTRASVFCRHYYDNSLSKEAALASAFQMVGDAARPQQESGAIVKGSLRDAALA